MSRNVCEVVNRQITQRLPLKPAKCRLSAPVASITFDDFPRSAWTVGGEVLGRHNARATYYAAGSFEGATADGLEYFTADDLKDIVAAGHEIGCHGFAHEVNWKLSSQDLVIDSERNAAATRSALGDYVMSSYAHPFGEASPRTKALLGARFATGRGIRKGVNAGVMDLSQLKAVGIEKWWWTPQYIEGVVAQAKAKTGWLIFFTHDVSDNPSPYGATPAMLDHALAALAAAQIEVLPVKHALARTQFDAG
jgi:peptidoglycan/xylan/chitin deacetylase (PgdA/CDA1 family)